jgi:hypothetical protein
MNMILLVYGVVTIALLVVHLLDYCMGRSLPLSAHNKHPAPIEGPPGAAAARPLPEPEEQYDRAA